VLGPRVQLLCAFVDSADVLATVIARRSLPRAGFYGATALAAGAAATGFYCSHRLAHD
jgi:hypothetical protein